MTQQFIGFKIVTAWPMDKETPEGEPNTPGYAIKYEDGYISWSPKEVFEKAYVPVDPNYHVIVRTAFAEVAK